MSESHSEEPVAGGTARRSRWPVVAASAVGLSLIAGAAGVAVGRATAPGPTIVVAPGPVVQQSPAASALPIAPDRPGLVVSETWGRLPAVFTAAPDLADEVGTASGYALTAGQVDGAALTSALADVFGVSGQVAQTGDGWQLGSNDGEAPTITVSADPLLSWSFSDPGASATTGGALIDPDAAREQAAALLAQVGVDVSTVDWQVDRFADQTKVTAWQLLRGSRTDLSWDLAFGRNGEVLAAHGFAAGIIEIPGYVVVGAATAVRRSAAPTWAALGPLPIVDTSSTPPGSLPAPTASGSAVPQRPSLIVPIARVEVVSAELGLAQYRQPDGAVLILPSYRVTGADGSRWSVIALTTADVDFVSVPYPSASASAP